MQGVYNHPKGRYPGRSYRKAGRYGVCVVCKVKGGMMGDCDGDEISGKCPGGERARFGGDKRGTPLWFLVFHPRSRGIPGYGNYESRYSRY